MRTTVAAWLLALLAGVTPAMAQDPTGVIEGQVVDDTGGVLPGAVVTVTRTDTGRSQESVTETDGFFRVPLLPVATYDVQVTVPQFAPGVQRGVRVSVSETIRVNFQLAPASVAESVVVEAGAALMDTSNALGRVVTGRELLDLPLNGRNFTQLGLLQTGVAPLTAGIATAGGSLRQGQAYAVNGARPEQNNYLVDGGQNINRMDGGYALRLPVDAIAEFRILTQSAPPEYGGTAGATTSVVTKSGGNAFHGSLYEFLRNDAFDARNFFSREVEPLNQHQFGGTIGGPIRRGRLFFFGYYEGFRNKQGITTTATVPTLAERQGDFSGMNGPLLNLAAGGTPFPGNQLPAPAISRFAQSLLDLYPVGNVSPSIYRETLVGENDVNQFGLRLDFSRSSNDQIFARYSYSGGHNLNPVSVRGTDVPGYPTRDDISAHSAVLSATRILRPSLTNTARATYLRYEFDFDQRIGQRSPGELGFAYGSSNVPGQGTPFLNISGYTPIGGAITGPRLSTQTSVEVADSLAWSTRRHFVKIGGDYKHTGIDMFQSIAPNAFFVFAGTFPTNNAVANLLLGSPVTFYQGLGNFARDMRVSGASAYIQDEWRLTSRLTMNYGLRYERIRPITEAQDRLNGFIPGVQSVVRPDAPVGVVFPGDPGVGKGIAHPFNAWMPRVGFAYDPTGDGRWSVRTSYGIYFDQFSNGSGTASQAAVSALPETQFVQFSGAGLNLQDPYLGRDRIEPNTFVRPSTVFGMDPGAKPPYTQHWNLSIQRALPGKHTLEARYVGSKGTHLPRNVEANPAVFGPGATAQNADRRRLYAGCTDATSPCALSTVGLLTNQLNSSYHAGQVSLSRRYADGLSTNISYWYSKSLDYLSAMNLSGSAAKPLAGENDLAQNPFDLAAEKGPSLFDARHRFVASVTWEPRIAATWSAVPSLLLRDWQINVVATHTSGTPFTVSDSTNVSLQANSPPISGFAASRPDLVGDPNGGPRTVDAWLSRDAFRRLDPQTEAGQFGDAGRNIARGPAYTNVDLALVRTFALRGDTRLQFRAEAFNLANHANFGLPVADLNSANFGRILSAGPSRLLQFALKLTF